MSALTKFESVKEGAVSAAINGIGARLRRFGAALLRGLHEQRRREAARIVAHERYLAGLGGAARLNSSGTWDDRPKVVPLRKAPATQPSSEPPDAPLDWPPGDAF